MCVCKVSAQLLSLLCAPNHTSAVLRIKCTVLMACVTWPHSIDKLPCALCCWRCCSGNPCDRVHFTRTGEPRSTADGSSSSSSSSSDDQDPLPGLNPVSLLQVRDGIVSSNALHAASSQLYREVELHVGCSPSCMHMSCHLLCAVDVGLLADHFTGTYYNPMDVQPQSHGSTLTLQHAC
jgi:hypothetical protein